MCCCTGQILCTPIPNPLITNAVAGLLDLRRPRREREAIQIQFTGTPDPEIWEYTQGIPIKQIDLPELYAWQQRQKLEKEQKSSECSRRVSHGLTPPIGSPNRSPPGGARPLGQPGPSTLPLAPPPSGPAGQNPLRHPISESMQGRTAGPQEQQHRLQHHVATGARRRTSIR